MVGYRFRPVQLFTAECRARIYPGPSPAFYENHQTKTHDSPSGSSAKREAHSCPPAGRDHEAHCPGHKLKYLLFRTGVVFLPPSPSQHTDAGHKHKPTQTQTQTQTHSLTHTHS